MICRRICALVCGSCLILLACGESRQILPGEGPVEQFARRGHWLYVYASQGASRSDLIRMTAFGRFEPGFSPGSAIDRFGEPNQVIPLDQGAEYVEYVTSEGRFRLGSEESADGDTTYPLYFFPNDRRPESLFPTYILRRLRLTADREVVMLFECGYGQPFMHATL